MIESQTSRESSSALLVDKVVPGLRLRCSKFCLHVLACQRTCSANSSNPQTQVTTTGTDAHLVTGRLLFSQTTWHEARWNYRRCWHFPTAKTIGMLVGSPSWEATNRCAGLRTKSTPKSCPRLGRSSESKSAKNTALSSEMPPSRSMRNRSYSGTVGMLGS